MNDASSSGRSQAPLVVVGNFIPRQRMPLSSHHPLPARICKLRAFLPGTEAQISSLTSSVRVKTSIGQPEMASLTIMIDKSSRSIPATSVQVGDKRPDVINLIDQASAPPGARPVGTLLRPEELQRLKFPWPELLDDARHAAAAARRPPIRPSRVLIDEDDGSPSPESACRGLGITLVITPKTLWANAIVERAFITIQDQFIDKLPGQSRSGQRDVSASEDDLILVDDLSVIFDRWVVQVWPSVRGDY
ncbi:hypothetical protein [Arthrobacter sp. NicSoilC5]|uniref:hypothetical protein n=1 Tax=Arthrobacter sp. NicSoilC5 TaxID=2831000 RepID=UPI001CC43C23|nr:hypothetical protein [Arthrobacter sp. NicSoilC5]